MSTDKAERIELLQQRGVWATVDVGSPHPFIRDLVKVSVEQGPGLEVIMWLDRRGASKLAKAVLSAAEKIEDR